MTYTILRRWVICQDCKFEVLVYWGSFRGSGKRCPGCEKVITFNNMESWSDE